MIRRTLHTIGAPARALELGLIRVYRATLSGWLGGQCRFYPTCSHYAEDAIRQRGAVKGTALAAWRVLRCNPFGRGGIDHVDRASEGSAPAGAPMASTPAYDAITPMDADSTRRVEA